MTRAELVELVVNLVTQCRFDDIFQHFVCFLFFFGIKEYLVEDEWLVILVGVVLHLDQQSMKICGEEAEHVRVLILSL